MNHPTPDGQLTPVQHEIMLLVWTARRSGLSVAEIWNAVKDNREVARTTILKLVERLETRGWLIRQDPLPEQKGSAMRFKASIGQRRARALLLQQFVDDYYDGSAAELARSLLKFRCLSTDNMRELRQLLTDRMK